MKLINKKQVNGKMVAIFDTEGAGIADIVSYLTQLGWTFAKLTVTYTAKGQQKKQDVPAAKVAAVQAKYHFDKWSFAASNGNQLIVCQISDQSHRALVSKAPHGAAKVFASIPAATPANTQLPRSVAAPVHEPSPTQPQLTAQQKALLQRKRELEAQKAAQTSRIQQERDAAAAKAAAALYAPQQDNENIPEMTATQRDEKRAAARAMDSMQVKKAAANKHTGLLIWAIIECLFIAPIAFGGFALYDIRCGRRLVTEDPSEAETRFKNAKQLLIFGIIFGILITGIACWKFLPVLL